MSLSPQHLQEYAIRPGLRRLELSSPSAEVLVLGTAAAESRLEYLRQLGSGPARGLWQVEPATHRDLWASYLRYRPYLAQPLLSLSSRPWGDEDQRPPYADVGDLLIDDLTANLIYGAAVCRLHYRRVPSPLPPANDFQAQAVYWKAHYNTAAGAGTVEHYVRSVREIVR